MKKILFFVLTGFGILTTMQINAQSKGAFEFNFTPAGSGRAYSGPGYSDQQLYSVWEYPEFSYGIGMEYKHNFGVVSLGLGAEYQNQRFGLVQNYFEYDSNGDPEKLGTLRTSLNHHYIGVPCRVYFNFMRNSKFNIQTFFGLNTMFLVDIKSNSSFYDMDGNHIRDESYSISDEGTQENIYSHYYRPAKTEALPIGVELQVGAGMKYNFTPKVYIFSNLMFGINMCTTYFVPGGSSSWSLNLWGPPGPPQPKAQHNFRYGGTIGLGLNF